MIDFGFRMEVNGEDLFSFYGCTEKTHILPFPEKKILDIHDRMTSVSSGDSYNYLLDSSEIAAAIGFSNVYCFLLYVFSVRF